MRAGTGQLMRQPGLIAPVLFAAALLGYADPVVAQIAPALAAADLQARINQRNSDIQALTREIAGYQKELDALSGQIQTLSSAIRSLDLTEKKLKASIALSEDKIAAASLRISQLAGKISAAQGSMDDERRSVSASFRSIDELGSVSLPESFLTGDSLTAVMSAIDRLSSMSLGLRERIAALGRSKTALESNRRASVAARAELELLYKQLSAERQVTLAAQAEKKGLLADTRDSETAYQKLLNEKRAQRDAFERELLEYESKLAFRIDAAGLPSSGLSILSWPLEGISVTQFFGNTPFATANPQVYNGFGHNGLDLRASIGTPVRSALGGVVSGTGDTDLVRGCYSFGRWVMIEHPNGLSTLYAHLSLPAVAAGQYVQTGAVIGYSGNTGYTTGPHLHFGVYATGGVELRRLDRLSRCNGAFMPVAALPAYLNPLSYLPPLSPVRK